MRDIIIYGFGGFGHEVACLIDHINRDVPTWKVAGFIDDAVKAGTKCKFGTVLGDIDTLNAWPAPIDVVIAICNPTCLKDIFSRITNPLVSFPNIVAPNCLFFDKESVKMGRGNVVTFGCRISCDVEMGDFNVLNGCISLGHNVVMGSYNVMLPDVRISGKTTIGDENFFGARCFAHQCLNIGDRNRFWAGSYILRNIKDGAAYMGNPAKRVEID